MKKIIVCKASPITKKEQIEGVEIHIKKDLPDFDEFGNLEKVEEFYKNEALDIYDALKNNLAQGVMHQLLILMLQGKQELYKGL